jgi:hypothetical protein
MDLCKSLFLQLTNKYTILALEIYHFLQFGTYSVHFISQFILVFGLLFEIHYFEDFFILYHMYWSFLDNDWLKERYTHLESSGCLLTDDI